MLLLFIKCPIYTAQLTAYRHFPLLEHEISSSTCMVPRGKSHLILNIDAFSPDTNHALHGLLHVIVTSNVHGSHSTLSTYSLQSTVLMSCRYIQYLLFLVHVSSMLHQDLGNVFVFLTTGSGQGTPRRLQKTRVPKTMKTESYLIT